jgi:CelD/BcsL family acetyltransferase involved in cellulose biosynthesis
LPAEPQQAGSGSNAPDGLRVELIDGEERLQALVPAWRELAKKAAEKNKLMEPAMALAAWRHLEGGTDIDWLFVWRQGGAEGERLIGVFALAARSPALGLPFRVTEIWRHGLGYLGTPLVHRHHVEEAVSAVLDWLKARGGGPRLLRLRQVAAEGPVLAAFRAELAARGWPAMTFDAHARAVLMSDSAGADYLRASLGGKRLKQYRRLEKRLGEEGALTFEILAETGGIARGAEEFLALEKAGWKGRRGTALAQDDPSRAYFDETMTGLAAEDGVRIPRLSLDGRALAVAILLVGGDAAWLYKIAHDETRARHSPGALLVVALTRRLLEDGEFRLIDSCAEPDHPMIDHIWRERVALTDLIAVLRPGLLPAASVFAAVRMARAARVLAKRALARLRR